MTVFSAVLCCIFTSFAVHYGWKMRGTVIGGEKGAMVPGMMAGLIPALFAGGGIARYFFIPAAAGLIGMSYGGIEPYGDSIAWIEDPNYVEPNVRKGYASLAVKGALWFSISGGYISMAISAMGGMYSSKEIILFPIFVLLAQFIGYRVFNQPYNPEKKIFPKIYLSFESRDEWGSNIGVLVVILIYAAIKKNSLSLTMTLSGLVFGAIGWIVAMRLYHYTEHPMKNGKFLLGVLSKKHLVGGWGNMEYCLGTFGGFGIALGFVLSKKMLEVINIQIALNGVFSPLVDYENIITIVLIVFFAALLAVNIYEGVCDIKGKKYNGFIMDCIERPFFNTFPFTFILFGSLTAAKLMTAFMLLYVLFIKNSFDRFKPGRAKNIFVPVSAAICIAAFVLCVAENFSFIWLLVVATVPYVLCEVIWCGSEKKRGGWKYVFSFNGFSFGILLLTVQSLIIITVGLIALTGGIPNV